MTEGRPAAYTGQADRDGCTFTRRAADGNGAAVFFDDLLHAGKPQADSGAFRGEKGLEDLVDEVVRDRGAVVLDEDLDVQTFPGSVLCHLDMQMPAGCHRLARVFENTQKDLLEFRFVGAH